MNLYSYVVTHDYGFAPNPFGGVLTLATCKPRIRRYAARGDWVIGTGSATELGCNKLIFAAKITEIMTISEYGSSARYRFKVPAKGRDRRCGDNIYSKDDHSEWFQHKNTFHKKEEMQHDLSGENVLICALYWYFGDQAPQLPSKFQCLIKKGPNHKNNTNHPMAGAFIDWIRRFDKGVVGDPSSRPTPRDSDISSRANNERCQTEKAKC